MSQLTIAVPSHYKQIVTKQQSVTASSVVLSPLVLGTDAIIGRPGNIFIQALAANTGKVYINFGAATIGGPGFELSAGSNINLPSNNIAAWFVIGTAGDKINITYQAQEN